MKNNESQEYFWTGKFGDEYIERNRGESLLASNISFFSNALKNAHGIQNCIEFGANIGMNIHALKLLYPSIDVHAVEINTKAANELRDIIPASQVHNKSIIDFIPSRQFDLTLIKGVLIHIEPEALPVVYEKLFTACGRYLMVAEYYNPSPVSVSYRGHSGRLFKRDFAGEIMDQYPQLELLDYGFIYHRDPDFPQDDITWFLMRKS